MVLATDLPPTTFTGRRRRVYRRDLRMSASTLATIFATIFMEARWRIPCKTERG